MGGSRDLDRGIVLPPWSRYRSGRVTKCMNLTRSLVGFSIRLHLQAVTRKARGIVEPQFPLTVPAGIQSMLWSSLGDDAKALIAFDGSPAATPRPPIDRSPHGAGATSSVALAVLTGGLTDGSP